MNYELVNQYNSRIAELSNLIWDADRKIARNTASSELVTQRGAWITEKRESMKNRDSLKQRGQALDFAREVGSTSDPVQFGSAPPTAEQLAEIEQRKRERPGKELIEMFGENYKFERTFEM